MSKRSITVISASHFDEMEAFAEKQSGVLADEKEFQISFEGQLITVQEYRALKASKSPKIPG